MDADRIDPSARAELADACGGERRLGYDGSGLSPWDQRPVRAHGAIREGLDEIASSGRASLLLERSSRETDERHRTERGDDPSNARGGDVRTGMSGVVEGPVELRRGDGGALAFGDRSERLALRADLRLEEVGGDVELPPPEAFPIDVRRMGADARARTRAGADDPRHRRLVTRVPAARDVEDVRDPVELFRLVVVLARIDVEEHRVRRGDRTRLRSFLHGFPAWFRPRGCAVAASFLRSPVMKRVFLFFLLLVGAFAFAGCSKYDELVEKDTLCDTRWADYQAQLQRRADLIPNLVETAKASANYEQATLSKITEARAAATSIKLTGEDLTDPEKVKKFEEAQAKLNTGSLSRLLVQNENYPKLQASEAFKDVMKSLEGTENRILRAREQYNEAVGQYNGELRKVKGSVVNKATGRPFKERVFFAASEGATAAPKVSF